MPFFSIIIPVYNSQKYLKSCLDSVLRQKFNDYEIILVDDCSTDQSKKICKSYEKDNKFQVYRNSKQIGAGLSRNVGLKLSRGKYIIFLDSDDLLYYNSLKGIFKLLKNKDKDIVIAKYNSDKPPYSNEFFFNKNFKNKKSLISSLNKSDYQTNNCWYFIIKRFFLIKNKIKFKNLKNCEDQEFVTKLLCKMNSFTFYRKNYYWYRSTEGSLSQSIDMAVTKSFMLFFVEMSKFNKKTKWEEYLKIFISRQIKSAIEQFSYRLVLHQNKLENNKIKKYSNKIKLKKFNSSAYLSSYKLHIVKNMLNNLNLNLIKNKNIYIYCAHVYGLALYQELAKKNLKLKSILDDNLKILKRKLNGNKIVIKSPEEIISQKNFNNENCKILVCARTKKTFNTILMKLLRLGIPKQNVINMVSYFYK